MPGTKISAATETAPVRADMIPLARTASAVARMVTPDGLSNYILPTLSLGGATRKFLDVDVGGSLDPDGLSFIEADTAGGLAATGDLETIVGGTEGDILVITPYSGGRTIVLKHLADNIWLRDEIDISLTTRRMYVLLICAYNSMWYQFL